jgi:hypothetical protein
MMLVLILAIVSSASAYTNYLWGYSKTVLILVLSLTTALFVAFSLSIQIKHKAVLVALLGPIWAFIIYCWITALASA